LVADGTGQPHLAHVWCSHTQSMHGRRAPSLLLLFACHEHVSPPGRAPRIAKTRASREPARRSSSPSSPPSRDRVSSTTSAATNAAASEDAVHGYDGRSAYVPSAPWSRRPASFRGDPPVTSGCPLHGSPRQPLIPMETEVQVGRASALPRAPMARVPTGTNAAGREQQRGPRPGTVAARSRCGGRPRPGASTCGPPARPFDLVRSQVWSGRNKGSR
jgi:hypothetical protein